MKQKALLIGVGNYQHYATTLESPAKDILLWKAILEAYGFAGTDIRLRIDADAKHDTILDDFDWLIDGVVADDQIVMVFLGHGRLVESHDGSSRDYEEALIIYPDGDRTLKSAEITDSDITAIISKKGLAAGVDAAIILDTCFAGAFDVGVPGATVLSIPPAFSLFDLSADDIRRFGSFGLQSDDSSGLAFRADEIERPVVVAASGSDQTALELPVEDEDAPHMLFTWEATKYIRTALAQNRSFSFNMLVRDISPLADDPDIDQEPEIRGNKTRAVEFFPGQPGSPTRVASLTFADRMVPVELDIRFEGIGCFADARDETDPYQKRLVFPHDTRNDPNLKHLTFIEIPRDHVDNWSGATPKTGPHLDNPTVFLRWELKGHVISVTNEDVSGPLTVNNLFRNHVPHMTDVYPQFKKDEFHPRKECFYADPGPLLDAYFDIHAGTLSTGPLDRRTIFVSDAGVKTLHIDPARYTTLRLPLKEEIAIIKVVTFGGADAATIRVKRGGKVVIGNTREGDIIGDGTTEDPRDHFNLYYKLAKNPPPDKYRPKPAKTAVPVNFCSQTTWP